MNVTALGMIETIGLVSAIEAADAGLKAANVRLLGTDYVRGGLVMVRFEGEVAAVQAAVDAGACAAKRVGSVFSAHVIPRAMPEVFCMLASDVDVGPGKLHGGGCAQCGGCEGGRRECEAIKRMQAEHANSEASIASAIGSTTDDGESTKTAANPSNGNTNDHSIDFDSLGSMRVVELRAIARKLPGFSMTANEIRFSNKKQLLEALAVWRAKEE